MADKLSPLLKEIVVGYLSASSSGQLTKGFASLDTKTILVKTRSTCPSLFKALKLMQDRSWVVLGDMDVSAVDVAVTATGLGVYSSGIAV